MAKENSKTIMDKMTMTQSTMIKTIPLEFRGPKLEV
jgi:hypothetical protein